MERDFFSDKTHHAVTATVAAMELHTAAEIVVAVRQKSGEYRQADYAFGALCAFVALLIMLFSPRVFSVRAMPIDMLLMFGLGAWVCSKTFTLRRLLTGRAFRKRQVATAARATFFDQGISRTRDRTGILVYVSILEREVALLADTGVATLPGWTSQMEEAVARADSDAFLVALRALAEPLSQLLPRSADDVDELSNALIVEELPVDAFGSTR